MNNELQSLNPSQLPVSATEINQSAQKIYNVQHADQVSTGDINTTIIMSSPQNGSSGIVNFSNLSHEYYNLFVLGGEEFKMFENGHFLVPKDRALTECMSPDIKDSVDSLSPEAISTVKTFPAIFCSENNAYGTCDESQFAYFGLITDVKIQDNGIKIYYQTTFNLPQKRLNEIISELGIAGTNRFNEFNRTHWCIKRIDLFAALDEAGIKMGF